jgi:hypothetical protein
MKAQFERLDSFERAGVRLTDKITFVKVIQAVQGTGREGRRVTCNTTRLTMIQRLKKQIG